MVHSASRRAVACMTSVLINPYTPLIISQHLQRVRTIFVLLACQSFKSQNLDPLQPRNTMDATKMVKGRSTRSTSFDPAFEKMSAAIHTPCNSPL